MWGNNKNSQQGEITIFIFPNLLHVAILVHLINIFPCSCKFSKPLHVFAFRGALSLEKGKETLKLIITQCSLENSQSVLILSTSIQYMQTKIKRAFIRLIMGLGGHDNWVRDEFLANVEL